MASETIQALRSSSTDRWIARVGSILAAFCLLGLNPLLYLFIDLMIWKGRVPSYSTLPPARQQQFRNIWNQNPGNQDYFKQPSQAESDSWETRWESSSVDWLKASVGEDAANAYIHQSDDHPGGFRRTHQQDESRLGILPSVVREQNRWTGRVLATIAKYCPWTWRPNANEEYLMVLFAIAFVLTAGAGFGAMMARHGAANASIETMLHLRRAVYQHASRMSSVALSDDLSQETGLLLTTRCAEVGEADERSLRCNPRNIIVIVGAVMIILLIHPVIGSAVLAGTVALWLIAGHIAAWFRRDIRHASRVIDQANLRLNESMQRQLLVKAYLMDRFAQTRIERQLDDCAQAEKRIRKGSAFSRPLLTIVAALAGIVLLYALGSIILGGILSIASVMQMLMAIGLLTWAVRSTIHSRVNAKSGRAAEADIGVFLDRRVDPGQSLDAEFLQPIAKRLEFHSVGVREPGSGKMLLDNITASIPAGSRVAVVSKDRQSLKSFAQAIVRFVEPTAGEIKADGKNLRWVTTDSLRTQIVYVAEDSLTMTDTVVNNIGCGDPGFGLPQVMEAAKVAHAHQFVQRLNYGYETLIGGPGTMLTTGQEYRIALARAILRDPSVLIVEEPIATIDPDSAALVDDTFHRIRKGRTIIQLASREATLRAADMVIVLEQGKIVANGTHSSLIQTSEYYRRMGYGD